MLVTHDHDHECSLNSEYPLLASNFTFRKTEIVMQLVPLAHPSVITLSYAVRRHFISLQLASHIQRKMKKVVTKL